MHTEAQRVRQEWDSARRVRAENEAGEAAWERRELEEKRRSAAVAAEEARHRQSMENDRKALDEERKIIAVAMEDLRRRELAIAPRERAAVEREARADRLEVEWETSEAALVHRGRNEEIRRGKQE